MFLKFKSQKFSFSPHIAGLQTQIDFSSSNPNRFTPQIFDVSLHTLNLKSLMDTLPSCFPTSGFFSNHLLSKDHTIWQNFELPSVADHPLGPATDHRLGSYALLTRPPLETPLPVRLACVKHAASVHPEPRFMLQVEGVAVSMHEVVRIERMCEDIH
ncbi:hypothetical protein P8452_04835 [Trifolium repens]|nr:hypothetical protein P8452_04835 [Trifolium repens]